MTRAGAWQHGGMAFRGFPDEAFIFYEGLTADNSKTYWTRHRSQYEQAVREPMTALGEELAAEFGPVRLFRPYRDVRFVKDKSPYKTHQGAYASTVEGVGYYVELDAHGLYAGGGLYSASSERIDRFRAAVDDETTGTALAGVVAALGAAGYAIEGNRLKTRPRGFPAGHPRIELLRHRSLYAGRRFEPGPWVYTEEALTRVRDAWREVRPLVDWLTTHVKP